METKGTANEANLPEKGAQQEVNENNSVTNENTSESIQNSDESEDTQIKNTKVSAKEESHKESLTENVEKQDDVTSNTEDKENIISEKVEDDISEKESDEHGQADKKISENKKEIEIIKEDFSKLDKSELLNKLNFLINNYEVEKIRDAVEEIKSQFYKKYKNDLAAAKKRYIEENEGVEDGFKFSDEASEETFKELYNQYKKKRAELVQRLEKEKEENLSLKYKIIDEINELINKEESINKTFQEFRDLQKRWRDVGLVPQKEVKDLWERYNHVVEKFYDYIKINKELRDLDLKKNLEAKIQLCEKAESLLLENSVTKAFKTLQEYHNQWREIGPVPQDKKDEIWDRFKAATTQINKKHQEYFEGLKEQQVKNLEQKVALCEKVEEILTLELKKPKEWEEKANELIEIQKLWRTIGFAPKKDNNKIYERFKNACDEFFAKKREFYKEAKKVQKNNLQLKLDLCIQAEALKDSSEWKKTTEDFINLQKHWKEIGPVPRKYSENVWKRFRTACDYFFDKKSEFFNTIDTNQEENLKKKLELIEKVKNFEKVDDNNQNLKILMEIQKEWSETGHVPINKKDEVQKQFRDAINQQFEDLKIEINERNKLNYKSKVDSWVSSNSRNKIYSERNKLVNKIKELENEIALYENNIGFFNASNKNSQNLLDEIHKKIDKAKERMETLKQKLRLIDKAEDEL
jgi:hypothetical protein